MSGEEITKRLEELERRIAELEKFVGDEKSEPKKASSNYRGLMGGIQKLMDEKFLDSPKKVVEINEELKRNGYHYPAGSVDKILRVDLLRKRNVLTRVKEAGIYKYAIKK